MTSEAVNDATAVVERRGHVAGMLRILFAGLLTAMPLPYTWARSFIGLQLTGTVEMWFGLGLVIVLAVVIGLTWHVGAAQERRRWLWPAIAAVACTWIASNVVMFSWRISTLIPRAVLIAAYVFGSLLVPWIAWMFFTTWHWRTRVTVTGLLLSLTLAFGAVFRVDGLSGDSNVDFGWRFADSARPRPASTVMTAHAGSTAGSVLLDNPERDYPQFLGPNRAAALPHIRLDRDWMRQPPRELWRRPIGSGWSSFAVVGDYAFTQEQRGDQECIACYRLATGDEVWMHADPVNFTSSLGGPGPRATPTIAHSRVFAVGATGILNCLDALSGRQIWSANILKDNHAQNIAHGICASPLVLADLVLVCPTGNRGPALAAYDWNTGHKVWAGGTHAASYSSPIAAEVAGVPQVLLCNSAGLTGYDCQGGNPLWHFDWTNSVKTNVAQPILHAGGSDQILISTGYDKGCALLRVDHSTDQGWSVRALWSNNHLKTKFCTGILYDEHAFGLDDGILTCIDLQTGRRAWKGGRYGHGQILRAGELLIIQAENGDVVLGELNPYAWRELGRIKALTGKTWNNPALAGPYLLVRNDHEAACFALPLLPTSAEPQASSQARPAPSTGNAETASEVGSNLR